MIELYNEDCFERCENLKPYSIDLVLTDPPYKLYTVGHGIMDNNANLRKAQDSLKKIKDGYDIKRFAQIVARLQKNINAYFFCSKNQIYEYMQVYIGEMKCNVDLLSWHKTQAPPFYYGKYLNDTEYILHFFKGQRTTYPVSYKDAASYEITPPIRSIRGETRYDHPTQKPLALVQRLIRNSSQEGGVVLDPFMGSGTTGEACVRENRQFIGMEIDKKYFKTAQERIQRATQDGKGEQLHLFG